jgi:predicted phosphodiesterase
MKALTKAHWLILGVIAAFLSCGSSSGTENSSGTEGAFPGYLTGGIAVYGDSRSGHADHRQIVEGIKSVQPVAVFHTGDLVSNGSNQGDWETFQDITGELFPPVPFYPAVGNHENPNNSSTLYFDQFTLPGNERWYSVDVDGIRFIVLDTVTSIASPASEQYQWLEYQLQSVSADSTPYSTGNHKADEKGLRQSIVPLFESHNVDVVFTGHDHNYERSEVNGITYVVTGGGGAPLRDQDPAKVGSYNTSLLYVKAHHFCIIYRNGGRVMVDVWSKDVELIDQFEISVP